MLERADYLGSERYEYRECEGLIALGKLPTSELPVFAVFIRGEHGAIQPEPVIAGAGGIANAKHAFEVLVDEFYNDMARGN